MSEESSIIDFVMEMRGGGMCGFVFCCNKRKMKYRAEWLEMVRSWSIEHAN